MPIYQNVNALPETNKDIIKMNLIKQITSPVQWENTINNMINDGISYFIELGPKSIYQICQKNPIKISNFIHMKN